MTVECTAKLMVTPAIGGPGDLVVSLGEEEAEVVELGPPFPLGAGSSTAHLARRHLPAERSELGTARGGRRATPS